MGIYVGSLHWLKTQTMAHNGQEPSALQAVCLGMAARSLAGFIMIPITVIKIRYESGTYNYHRMSSALVQIYRLEGYRGLCCGLVPTLVRDAPYSGLYLMFYTQLKQLILPHILPPDNRNSSSMSAVNFGCGTLAGFLASLVTHPADVIKTKMQLRPDHYNSVRTTARLVWQEGNGSGFLVGLVPRTLRRTLMSALAWTVYEELMQRAGLK